MKVLSLAVFLLTAGLVDVRVIERIERVETKTWHLGMNLNPADGHIMDYTTGWVDDVFIGTYADALKKDYLNRMIWRHPVNYIALVRHQDGEVDAVKVFRFKEGGRSLLSRFQDMNPGRKVVTEGGPLQESISANARYRNMGDDPVFSVGGDLAFNWVYTDNGHRIVLTGGNLSPVGVNDDNTHGLGNHFGCNPLTGVELNPLWSHEISNIQNCSIRDPKCDFHTNPIRLQGTDHGDGWRFGSGPVYGNYAIYVSKDAATFPGPGYKLQLEINVEQKFRSPVKEGGDISEL